MLRNVNSGYNITNVHQGSSKNCPIYSTMSQETSGPDSSNISTTTSGQNRLKTPFVNENTAELRISIFAKYCRITNRHTSKLAISVKYVLPILNSAYFSVTLSSMPILNSADFSVIKYADSLFSSIYIEIYTSLAFTHSLQQFTPSPPHPSTPLALHQHHIVHPLHPLTPPQPSTPSTSTMLSIPFTPHPLPLHQHHILPPIHPLTPPQPSTPSTSTMLSIPFTPHPLPLHQHHILPPIHPLTPPQPSTPSTSTMLSIPFTPHPLPLHQHHILPPVHPLTPPQPSPTLNVLTYYNLFLSFYSAMDHPAKQRIQCTLPIPTHNQRHLQNPPNLIHLWM